MQIHVQIQQVWGEACDFCISDSLPGGKHQVFFQKRRILLGVQFPATWEEDCYFDDKVNQDSVGNTFSGLNFFSSGEREK